MTNDEAELAAREWAGQAGGKLLPQLTANELAGIVNEAIRRALISGSGVEPVALWQGANEWEQLAYELCAEEHGEESCHDLLWDGGYPPEPWGERWQKYEGEAKRMIELVRKYAPSAPVQAVPDANLLIADALERFANSYCWDAVEGPRFYRAELLKWAANLRDSPPHPPLSSDGGESTAQYVACPTDKEK